MVIGSKEGQAQVPAVVMSLTYSGLGLVRSLRRRGVPLYALDHVADNLGLYSKYPPRYICPNPKNEPNRLLRHLNKLGQKAVCRPFSSLQTMITFYLFREIEKISEGTLR